MISNKPERYRALVSKFKKHVFKDAQLINPHNVVGFNFDVLSPWELWHNNLDADIMFIGQDFSDEASLIHNLKNDWKKERKSPTNTALIELFSVLGFHFDEVNFNGKNKYPLFFTNAILGIKSGGMVSPVKNAWWQENEEYLKELIDIISPKYIIAMGKMAYNAICKINNINPKNSLDEVIGEPIILPDNRTLFVVQHCSRNGRISRNESKQIYDWIAIRNVIDP